VLGPLCVTVLHNRCHGVVIGTNHDGSPQPLSAAANFVAAVGPAVASQIAAMNGGAMNAFDQVIGCKAQNAFACYTAYQPPRPGNLGFMPNAAALANNM
jgi:hypothetical protein